MHGTGFLFDCGVVQCSQLICVCTALGSTGMGNVPTQELARFTWCSASLEPTLLLTCLVACYYRKPWLKEATSVSFAFLHVSDKGCSSQEPTGTIPSSTPRRRGHS